METKKTAVIYARQSYGAEENSLSVDQQIERCKAWCNRNGVDIVAVFADNNTSSELYPDNAKGRAYCSTDIGWQRWRRTERSFKGRKPYRRGLADAFDCIEHNTISYFVVDEVTRLYRNPSATSQLDTFCIVTLQEAKCSLVSASTNNIDPLNNNVEIAMWRAFAVYEMEKVNEKAAHSKANRKANIANGNVFSNAFGIDWINKKIHYNADKMEVIKYVFNSVIENKTYGEILFNLNKHFSQFVKKSFYETSIYNIVKNSVYCGLKQLEDGKFIEIQNLDNNPPISFIQYKKANEIMQNKKGNCGKRKSHVKGVEKKHFLPLSGLFYCGYCGHKLVVTYDNGIVYFCRDGVRRKNKECTPSRIRMNFANDPNDFYKAIQPLFLLKLIDTQREMNSLNNSDGEINKLQMEIDNLNAKIKSVYQSAFENNVDINMINGIVANVKKELIEKENRLAELNELTKQNKDELLAEWSRLNRIITEGNELLPQSDYERLLRSTIKAIKVYEDRITVVLYDGNECTIPRITHHHRTKGVPTATANNYIRMNGTTYVRIAFDCGYASTICKTAEYTIVTQ